MLSADHHQRQQNGMIIDACRLYGFDDVPEGRFGFDRGDETGSVSFRADLFLQFGVDPVGFGIRAVPHKADRRVAVIEAGGPADDGCDQFFLILFVRKERLRDPKLRERAAVRLRGFQHALIFMTCQDVCGRQQERRYLTRGGVFQRFLHARDHYPVSVLQFADDHARSEGALYAVIGKCLCIRLFDRADRFFPAVLIGRSERYRDYFFFHFIHHLR